jgi:hypothetical protein
VARALRRDDLVNGLVLTLGLCLAVGVGPAAFAAEAKAPRPIRVEDLRPAINSITIGSIRKEERITNRAFSKKLEAALRSPTHLKQTFPGLVGHLIDRLVGTEALPGKVGAVGFDAHIENVGPIKLGRDRQGRQRTIDGIVDTDDSGNGPASVDALSIGTSLVQDGYSKKTLHKAALAFAAAAKGRSSAPPEVEGPKWGKMRKRWLAGHTRKEKRNGAKVLSFKGYERAAPAAYAAIAANAGANAVFKDYELLDIADDGKSTGGSGGMLEFRLLMRKKATGKVHVYMMKEQQVPGAATLGVRQPSVGQRITLFKKDLWTEEMPADVFFYMQGVKIGGRSIDFLVRNQFSQASYDPGRRSNEVAVDAARVYGRAHAGDFGNLTEGQIADWMEQSAEAMTQALGEVHQKLRDESKAGRE